MKSYYYKIRNSRAEGPVSFEALLIDNRIQPTTLVCLSTDDTSNEDSWVEWQTILYKSELNNA